MSRGIEQRLIFKDARDRYHFVDLLPRMRKRFAVNLFAYVLMENHYHLLLQTPEPNLSQTIQWLNVSYSVWFNRRHRRVGPLFQGRFKAMVEPWKDFAQCHGDFGRDLALYLGRRLGGLTLSALGKLAAGMNVMAVSLAVKRFAQKLETNKQLRKAATAVERNC